MGLPGPWRGSVPCGKLIGPVESLLALWRAYWLCGGPIGSVESLLALWRAHWPCGEPIGPVGRLYALERAMNWHDNLKMEKCKNGKTEKPLNAQISQTHIS